MTDYDFDERYYDDDVSCCEVCGAELMGDEGGCPACLPCGGEYSPGTEECDWCEYADECAAREYDEEARDDVAMR